MVTPEFTLTAVIGLSGTEIVLNVQGWYTDQPLEYIATDMMQMMVHDPRDACAPVASLLTVLRAPRRRVCAVLALRAAPPRNPVLLRRDRNLHARAGVHARRDWRGGEAGRAGVERSCDALREAVGLRTLT